MSVFLLGNNSDSKTLTSFKSEVNLNVKFFSNSKKSSIVILSLDKASKICGIVCFQFKLATLMYETNLEYLPPPSGRL